MRYQLTLLKNSNGTYSFVGTVPVRLAWKAKDGSRLTDEQAKLVAGASMPAMHARVRVFENKNDALEAAKIEGIEDIKSIPVIGERS